MAATFQTVMGSNSEEYKWGCKCVNDPEKGGCIQCDGDKCKARFHRECADLTDVLAEYIDKWFCTTCCEAGHVVTYEGIDNGDDEDPGERIEETFSIKTAGTARRGGVLPQSRARLPAALTVANIARLNAANAANPVAVPDQYQNQDQEYSVGPSEQERLPAADRAEKERWAHEANMPMFQSDGYPRAWLGPSEGGFSRDGTHFSEPPFPVFASYEARFGILH